MLFTGTLLFLWKNRELALRRSLPFSLQAAAASVIIFLVLYMGTRLIAAHIPPLFSGTGGNDTAEITTGKSIYDQPDNDLPGRDQLINDLAIKGQSINNLATNDLAIKGLVSGSPASGIKTGLSGMHSLVAESLAPAVAFTSDSAFASDSAFTSDDERTFDPEYNWNYEVGFKGSMLDHTLQADRSQLQEGHSSQAADLRSHPTRAH